MKSPRPIISALAQMLILITVTLAAEPARISLVYDPASRPMAFAAGEIRAACAAKGHRLIESASATGAAAPLRINLCISADASVRPTGPQAYSIRRLTGPARILVTGADDIGAMYGGLDVAEAIRLGTLDQVGDSNHRPHIERRGIKFNIPLDARTPSYSDNADAAQQNIPEMWSMDFWRTMLDEMARHRYNVLTLWSLHPFPSMVKVPEFPDVALDDVMRTTIPLDDTFSHTGTDMVRPEMLKNLDVVKRMSIDDKIRFWRDVMQHAHDRGIEVYIFTWNIFTFGATGKYGITPSQTDQKTIEYFRASVREMVLTYPHLAGFGITSGESMQDRKDEFSKEKWLWRTHGEGIRDAKKLVPGRKIRLIHRFHMTGQDEILREFADYPDQLDLSFKYAIAHMYSTPTPPFIKAALPHLGGRLRTWLTVRNDDIYSFRWGDPAYARAFVRAIPPADKIAGFYMGPDGYIWGREFLSTEPETPRQLVIQKQWYSFMLWGRLSYEPDLPDELFRRTIAIHFPQVPADKLYDAWASASKIFPQITRFFWGDIDLKWLPEACLSHPRHKGFYTVRHFIEGQTMPESGIVDIFTWREAVVGGKRIEGTTPLQVAAALRQHAATTLAIVAEIAPSAEPNKELRLTLGDLAAMSHLGNYYAEKIEGACDLAIFDRTGNREQQTLAIEHLQKATAHWKAYAEVCSKQYKPALYNRVGFVNIPALLAKVNADEQIARDWRPGTIDIAKRPKAGADVPFRK